MRCVRFHVIRVVRNPLVRHTSRFVERRVIHSSVASFVPSLLNDVMIHHQKCTPERVVQLVSDDVSVTFVTALAMTLLIQTGISIRTGKPEHEK